MRLEPNHLIRAETITQIIQIIGLQKIIQAVFHDSKLCLINFTCLYDVLCLCFTRVVITDAHRVTRYVAEQFTRA